MADISDDSFVLDRCKYLSDILRSRYKATGRALGEMVSSVADELPISAVLGLRRLAEIRNKVAKDRIGFPVKINKYEELDKHYFGQLCDEVEAILDGIMPSGGRTGNTAPLVPQTKIVHEKVALQAFNGQFVTALLHQRNELIAGVENVAEWETFEIYWLGENKVALRAFNNLFVMAHLEQGGELFASRPDIQGWETFTIHYLADKKIALQAFNDLYVSAKLHDQCQLAADCSEVAGWEIFRLVFL